MNKWVGKRRPKAAVKKGNLLIGCRCPAATCYFDYAIIKVMAFFHETTAYIKQFLCC
jgi:hypothetical protein